MEFKETRGIGYCGLACVLCSYEDCPGCYAKIKGGDDCSAGKCAAEKSIDGCYACSNYPCDENMLQGKRNRAFNRYAKEFGKQALIDRLRINFENGITYHKPDKSAGDYDVLETENEIYKLVRFGASNPYKKCPDFKTKSFTLRLIAENDTEDLFNCYADPETQKFINADGCWDGYNNVSTVEMMRNNVVKWIGAYNYSSFIRFTVIDNKIKKAIGTVEMFYFGMITSYTGGILRIDLASAYETKDYISEILTLANKEFFALFDVECIVTKAIPAALDRIAALQLTGYELFEWEPEREHYYIKKNPNTPL